MAAAFPLVAPPDALTPPFPPRLEPSMLAMLPPMLATLPPLASPELPEMAVPPMPQKLPSESAWPVVDWPPLPPTARNRSERLN